jgi:hypothetical protein
VQFRFGPADGVDVPLFRDRRSRRLPLVVALVAMVLAVVDPAVAGLSLPGSGWTHVSQQPVAEGVVLSEHTAAGPVRSTVLHAPPGAPIRFGSIVSGDRIDGGLETVAAMCQRSGAVACVNANFSVCSKCDQPFGAVVRDGVILRTPVPEQDTVSVVRGRLTSEPWSWSASLRSVADGDRVAVDGINTGPIADGVVMHTRDFGPRTQAPPGGYELEVRAPAPIRTGPGQRQPGALVRTETGGTAAIPADGVVLSGLGSGAERLRRFVESQPTSAVELAVHSPAGLEQAVGGHPVLLRDGQPLPLDTSDRKISDRHPRTVIGWDDHGAVWIVVTDGRQDHSRGLTLAEATAHLQGLGATHAVNLDGGGSSTMVARCPDSTELCVRNRPSDGFERSVTVAFAVFGTLVAPPAVPAAAEPSAPIVLDDAAEAAPPAPVPAPPAPAPEPEPEPVPPTTVAEPAPVHRPRRQSHEPPRADSPSVEAEHTSAAVPLSPAHDDTSARGAFAALAAAIIAAEAIGLLRLRLRVRPTR